MQRPRRKRLLTLIARVDSARRAIAGRRDEAGEAGEAPADNALIARQLALLGRRSRLLLAYLDDNRRAHHR